MNIRDYRFETLPRPIQIAVFSILILGLAFVFYSYYLKDMIAQRDVIQKDIERLEISVAQGTAIESRLRRFRQEVQQLEDRLAVLKNILPAEKETPTILRSVQEMAASTNLKINRFAPQPVVPRAFYSDWPIQIEVEGNYNGLGRFFERISQATRIINVDSISITGISSEKEMNPMHTLNANCTATTFVFREEQPVTSTPEPVKGKKKGVKS
jgi:type IV pilus assembly protein PilO